MDQINHSIKRPTPSRPRWCQHAFRLVSPRRMLTIILARCSSQTDRAPRSSETGLILPVLQSLVHNLTSGQVVKCYCVQSAGSTRQWCILQFRDVAIMSHRRTLHVRRGGCIPMVELRCRDSSFYEGFVGLATLLNILRMSFPETYFRPHWHKRIRG